MHNVEPLYAFRKRQKDFIKILAMLFIPIAYNFIDEVSEVFPHNEKKQGIFKGKLQADQVFLRQQELHSYPLL